MFLGKCLKSPLKNASTYDGDRKYLRWPSKVLALALASTFIFLPTFVRDNDRIDNDARMKCDVEKSQTYMKRKKVGNLSIINLLVPRPGIEPGWIAPLVFETSASTDSAIWAFSVAKVLIIFELTNFFGEKFQKRWFFLYESLNYCFILPSLS